MKKLVSKILSICLTGVLLLAVVGCKSTAEYDYTASELKIQARESFSPCYFLEFFSKNEHCQEYFSEILPSVSLKWPFIVTIDGENWTQIDFRLKELPQGIYDIVVETSEDAYLIQQTETETIKIPYEKKIIIPVFVSLLGEDKYCAVV